MSKYDRQIASAQRLIAKKGQAVTWLKRIAVADVNQPWKEVAADPKSFDVTIVFLRPSGGLTAALISLMKGTDVPTGRVRGLMAAVDFNVEITDTVIRNGASLNIQSIDAIAPDGTPVLYVLGFC